MEPLDATRKPIASRTRRGGSAPIGHTRSAFPERLMWQKVNMTPCIAGQGRSPTITGTRIAVTIALSLMAMPAKTAIG